MFKKQIKAAVNDGQVLDRHFRRITDRFAQFPAWNITEALGRCTLRFFDTTPISPSGRYLAVTRLASDSRVPEAGEPAEIILLDLLNGQSKTSALSHWWDAQLGAQVQWGRTDSELYFNDLRPHEWRPFGVRLNPFTGDKFVLEGTIYMISPDGKTAASPCLLRAARTQAGYGAVVPEKNIPINSGAPADDGLYVTDTQTGKSRLLVSLKEIVEQTNLGTHSPISELYGFHVKWNPSGTRLMFVVRNRSADGKRQSNLVTMASDGSDIKLALGWSRWSVGGHHPNWIDDESILMNLRDENKKMRFYRFRYDGKALEPVHTDVIGSGHPTWSPDGEAILTDAYLYEKAICGDGATKVPLRYIDNITGKETALLRIGQAPTAEGEGVMRVDPHPAWSPDGKSITFNGNENGTRNVYLAHVCSQIIRRQSFWQGVSRAIRKRIRRKTYTQNQEESAS